MQRNWCIFQTSNIPNIVLEALCSQLVIWLQMSPNWNLAEFKVNIHLSDKDSDVILI